MGYNTDFSGRFDLDKPLLEEDRKFLENLAATRRMKRDLSEEFGVEGEFYFGDDDSGVIDYNRPPSSQPGLWCMWVPTEDGKGIEWDGGEKFYDYVEWIEYIIEKILKPRGYLLNGKVRWFGEDRGDNGAIIVNDNLVTRKELRMVDDDGICHDDD